MADWGWVASGFLFILMGVYTLNNKAQVMASYDRWGGRGARKYYSDEELWKYQKIGWWLFIACGVVIVLAGIFAF